MSPPLSVKNGCRVPRRGPCRLDLTRLRDPPSEGLITELVAGARRFPDMGFADDLGVLLRPPGDEHPSSITPEIQIAT